MLMAYIGNGSTINGKGRLFFGAVFVLARAFRVLQNGSASAQLCYYVFEPPTALGPKRASLHW